MCINIMNEVNWNKSMILKVMIIACIKVLYGKYVKDNWNRTNKFMKNSQSIISQQLTLLANVL